MTTRTVTAPLPRYLLLLAALPLLAAGMAWAQVPVDDEGNPIGSASSVDENDSAGQPPLSMQELEPLVGRIALYPDDLLAIVLPASTYPLEIVQAARFLDRFDADSSVQPDDSWDESVTALLNYPEVLRMMNEDIDWTWKLGEAVVAQQSDVIKAVETFRDRAYAAGNLKSDEHQTVSKSNEDVIEIEPVEDDTIYVPYYEPERVVVYQPQPVYYYYPRSYPVYYYPYPVGHHFASDYFWGVTTAFSIGWSNNYLHVYHPSFNGHPYYGHHYYGNYWRRPSIQVFNRYYGNPGHSQGSDRDRHGSYWRPRHHGGPRPGRSQARSRYYANQGGNRSGVERHASRNQAQPGVRAERRHADSNNGAAPVRFRNREQTGVNRGARAELAQRHNTRATRNDAATPSQRRDARSGVAARRARIAASQPANGRRAETVAESQQRRQPAAQGATRREPISIRGRTRQSIPRSAPPQRRAAPTRRATPDRHANSTRHSDRNRSANRRNAGNRPSSNRQANPSNSRRSSGARRDGNRRRNHH